MKTDDLHLRVLILAPTGRDASLARQILTDGGITSHICRSLRELTQELHTCGAVLLTEEVIRGSAGQELAAALDAQPPWSDLPLLIFAANTTTEAMLRSWEVLGERANITFIDRPVKIKTLVSAVHTALRSRKQQYHVRTLMEQLEARVRERDKFLAILGHELRNPLTAILLSAQMLSPDDPDANEEQLETIVRQSRQLSRLVNDLLDISRVTSGKIRLSRRRLDLNREVRQAIESMSELFRENELWVSFEPAEDELWIDGDQVRVEQILANILMNAVKYTPPGGHIEIHTRGEDGHVEVRVVDDGVGIAPEMLDKIFELFTQVDDTIDRSRGGMGVGLTLVRNLVELHGGQVAVHSDGTGKGSSFGISFPRAAAPDPASGGANPDDVDRPLRRIVLIEDNPDIRRLLELKLRALGHDVTSAEDGEHGLALLLERRPEVGIVDIGLPGLDGYEVARRFKESVPNGTRLVALTGYGQADDRRKAEDAGFDHHLTKPPEFDELERLLSAM